MKRVPKPVLRFLITLAAAVAIHFICGRILAGRDIVAAALVEHDSAPILAALILVLARLFLFLLAPGWALYRLVHALLNYRALLKVPRGQ